MIVVVVDTREDESCHGSEVMFDLEKITIIKRVELGKN